MKPLVALAVVVTVLSGASRSVEGAAADRIIVALGDSLTAGFGVARDEAYPAQLEARLRGDGYHYRVVNAGVSGDTSAGGLRRLDWVLRVHPEIAIVALGANDGLRGQSVTVMRANLAAILDRLRAGGVPVLLAGMQVPPNYGEAYARDFAAVFADLGRRPGVTLMPFLLEGVAANDRLNQGDGIHPTAEGHRVIAERMYAYLEPLLRK
jgi:acyl-CoA thioesterase-1